jgi:hypothetical protein
MSYLGNNHLFKADCQPWFCCCNILLHEVMDSLMSAASAPDIALVVLNNSSALALLWRMQNHPVPFTLSQITIRRVALQEATWHEGYLAICFMQWLTML